MQLENLMLTKEEIPILHENCFQVPIHPKLLSSDIEIDESLAKEVFPKVAKEWYKELGEYSEKLEDKNMKKWIDGVFLKKKPKIKKDCNNQILDTLYWKDEVFTLENGFARSLSISRNTGGTLYFNEDNWCNWGCKAFYSFDSSTGYIRLSKDKALEFNIRTQVWKINDNLEGVELYVYTSHNIDYYPGALFLRNWALLYLNEAMKQVLK